MNKTLIEWTDFTFNPVTGCWGPGGTAEKPNRCPYCYAKRIADRFFPVQEVYHQGQGTWEEFFAPMFYPERLSEPAKIKTPSKIFVSSMGDLFGDWVPREQILDVLTTVKYRAPWHTYQFLGFLKKIWKFLKSFRYFFIFNADFFKKRDNF